MQASNYTLARQIRPRYLGSRNEGLYYNKWSPSGSSYNNTSFDIPTSSLNTELIWGGDSSYGKTAVIDQYGSYGLYYNGSGTGDLLNGGPDKIFLNTQFMFDEQGNTLQPKVNSPYYWNGISSFVKDSEMQITVYNSSSVSDKTLAKLQEKNTVNKPFTYYNSYLMTASGSVEGETGNDAFEWSGSINLCGGSVSAPVCTFITPTGTNWFSTLPNPAILAVDLSLSLKFRQSLIPDSGWTNNSAGPSNSRIGYNESINNILPRVGSFVCFRSFDGAQQNTLQNEYRIVDVDTVTNPLIVYLTLDRPLELQNTQDINRFIMFDKIPDTSKLYTNIPLDGSVVGSGFIFTDNTSDSFKNALDANISDFDVKRLI